MITIIIYLLYYIYIIEHEFNITINSNYTFGKDFYYNEVVLLSRSQTILNIEYSLDLKEINKSSNFILVQVHSFLYNVSLSYDSKLKNGNHFNGSNIGTTVFESSSKLFVFNFNNVEVKAALIAILYEKSGNF